jgi:hypothetical protein
MEHSTEVTLATALVVAFAGDESICVIPTDGSGSKTYCQQTGTTITYRDDVVLVQTTREGGGIVHTWLLSLRRNPEGEWVGFFNGDDPTPADLDRLKEASLSARFDISGALARQKPEAYADDERLAQASALVEALVVRFPVATVLAKRGGPLRGNRLP